MNSLARHTIQLTGDGYKNANERLSDLLKANDSHEVASCALNVLRLGSLVDPKNANLRETAHIAAEALTDAACLSQSADTWLDAFWLAMICRDAALLDSLCETSADDLKKTDENIPAYKLLFIDALRTHWQSKEDVRETLIAAMEATAPGRSDIAEPDFVCSIDVPLIELTFHVLARNSTFLSAFHKAIEHHKQYWSTSERSNDPRGFVSFGLTALVALGSDCGFVLDITSEYLMAELIPDSWR